MIKGLYVNPSTGKPVSEYRTIDINNRKVPDLRFDSGSDELDEYAESDPYPKDEGREDRLKAFVSDIILPMLPELVQKDQVLLDTGCGTGDWLWHVYNESKRNHSVYAAEYSSVALSVCLKRNYFIHEACLFDANNYPFKQNFFNVILAINIFEHIKSPILFLERAIASLKPGGAILMTTPSRYTFKNLIKAFLGKRTDLLHPIHITEYTVGQIKEIALAAGGKVTGIKGSALVVKDEKFYHLTSVLAPLLQGFITHIIRSHHLLHRTVYYRIEKNRSG